MQSITNDINQTIVFVDGRESQNQANPATLTLTHIATNKEEILTTAVNFDATEWSNGLYSCQVVDAITLIKITSFIVKVIDIKSLTLTENDNALDLGYAKNQ